MTFGEPVKLEALMKTHKWFAIVPVRVETTGNDGCVYSQFVWLRTVKRTLVRVQGISVFKYEPA